MYIAQEKRKSNIAEYIIYMWHIEDFIRACNFDIEKIKEKVMLPSYTSDQRKEVTEWFESLIQMMKEENITEKGHLGILDNLVEELEEVHKKILSSQKQNLYNQLYSIAQQNIKIYRSKSDNPDSGDIRLSLEALYLYLLMKISGREISLATREAIDTFAKWLAHFSKIYLDWENGKTEID